MAQGHEFFNLRGVSVSPDNKLASFGVDTVSRRQYTIQIKNLEICVSKIDDLGEKVSQLKSKVASLRTSMQEAEALVDKLNEDLHESNLN